MCQHLCTTASCYWNICWISVWVQGDSFCSVTGGVIWRLLLLLTSRRAQGGPLTLQKHWSSDLSFASLTFSATASRSAGDRSYPTCRLARSGPVVSFSLNKLSMTESRFCLLWKLTFALIVFYFIKFAKSIDPSNLNIFSVDSFKKVVYELVILIFLVSLSVPAISDFR